MKIIQSVLLFLAVPAAAFTEVSIKVSCKGAKFNKLSVSDKTEVSHALQDSYNSIHSGADNDDSQLTDVHWGSYGTATLSEEIVGQGGGWNGDYDCSLCPDDDDAMLGVSTAGHKLWETTLTETLVATGRPTFKNLKSCSIKMSPRGLEATMEDETELSLFSEEASSETPVYIAVKCKGINFAKLSVADDTIAGHILQDSYNEVHEKADNDDSRLSNVKYGGAVSLGTVGQGGGWNGDYDCSLCPDDDDALLAVGATGANLKMWEEQFVLGLTESGRKSFENVHQCSIKMGTRGMAEAEENGESTKCGLRACAEE